MDRETDKQTNRQTDTPSHLSDNQDQASTHRRTIALPKILTVTPCYQPIPNRTARGRPPTLTVRANRPRIVPRCCGGPIVCGETSGVGGWGGALAASAKLGDCGMRSDLAYHKCQLAYMITLAFGPRKGLGSALRSAANQAIYGRVSGFRTASLRDSLGVGANECG